MFVHLEVKPSRSTIKGHLDAAASAWLPEEEMIAIEWF